ncbi:MAG TPA: hypothetical protein VIL74_09010 [Pyrinomonadaceae bacterium]|jgi:hypothetical protein
MDGQNENNTTETPDFDAMTTDELRTYMTEQAQAGLSAPETEDETETAETAETTAETIEPDAEPEAETEETEETENAAPVAFSFTEDADAETFRAEADRYLETVELTPEAERILNHYRDAALANEEKVARYESFGEPETTERTMQAFSRVLEFVPDAETGDFVPDAAGIVDLLNKDFASEKRHILLALNTQASDKYAGMTVFQEFFKDNFGFSDVAMSTLETFIENGGEMPVPRFTPAGVDERFAEAYWKSMEREAIQKEVDLAAWTLSNADATKDEKLAAERDLARINQRLQKEQAFFDGQRKLKEESTNFASNQRQQIESAAETSFLTDTDALAASLSEKIARSLPFVEGAGAEITADGFVSLIRQAYSEREHEARAAQTRLRERGVAHDWAKGRELLDRLFENEQKLAFQTANKGTNPRAIENTRRAKANLLRDLRKEELQIVGKITSRVARDAGKALERKVENAPKIKAVRARVAGDGSGQKPKANFDTMSKDELRRVLNDPTKRALYQGDLSGFAE